MSCWDKEEMLLAVFAMEPNRTFFKSFYLFLEKGEGKEKGRQRNIYVRE